MTNLRKGEQEPEQGQELALTRAPEPEQRLGQGQEQYSTAERSEI